MDASGNTRCDPASRECLLCHCGESPLQGEQLRTLVCRLGRGWLVAEKHHREKEFILTDFRLARELGEGTGELAESVGHHPEICLRLGRCTVTVWMHKMDGLVEVDFVFAAKVAALRQRAVRGGRKAR